MAQRQPPPPPQIAAAQIRAQSAEKVAQLREQGQTQRAQMELQAEDKNSEAERALQRMAIEHGYTYGIHFLPHDADYKRMGESPDTNRTIKEMLERLLPGQRFEIVPRVTILMNGIQATRASFPGVWFDEEGCAEGIKRLDNYRKKWYKATGAWADDPLHDDNSHGADAFRQWGQVVEAGHSFAVKAAGQKAFRRSGSPLAT